MAYNKLGLLKQILDLSNLGDGMKINSVAKFGMSKSHDILWIQSQYHQYRSTQRKRVFSRKCSATTNNSLWLPTLVLKSKSILTLHNIERLLRPFSKYVRLLTYDLISGSSNPSKKYDHINWKRLHRTIVIDGIITMVALRRQQAYFIDFIDKLCHANFYLSISRCGPIRTRFGFCKC